MGEWLLLADRCLYDTSYWRPLSLCGDLRLLDYVSYFWVGDRVASIELAHVLSRRSAVSVLLQLLAEA